MPISAPSERLIPVLSTIELAVADIYLAHRGLRDKDVEFIYQSFLTFFKGELSGQELAEPSSRDQVKQALIDLIFDYLEEAEDANVFADLLDGSYSPSGRPVSQVEELYISAFNYLKKSARFWRKREGERGYLRNPILELKDHAGDDPN